MNRIINVEISLAPMQTLVGLVLIENICCPGRPVLIVRSMTGMYSTQCACGGKCSNAHHTATAAVLEYKSMSKGCGLWDTPKIGEALDKIEDLIEALATL